MTEPMSEQAVPAAGAGASGLAVTGLMLGVLGFCSGGVTALIGLVLGIVALAGARRQRAGRGLAVTAVGVSAAGLVAGPLLGLAVAAIAIPSVTAARDAAQNARATMMLTKLGWSVQAWADDHNGALPPPGDWVEALRGYAPEIDVIVASPVTPGQGRAYAMNRFLDGATLDSVRAPSLTVLLFEAAPGSPPSGGQELMPSRPRSRQGYLVMFVDGGVENVRKEQVRRLVWEP